jgi:hypothetical protein
MQAALAAKFPAPGGGADYARVLAIVAVAMFAAVGFLAAVGPEAKERSFGGEHDPPEAGHGLEAPETVAEP